jgi:DnaJ family protein C protein 13
VYKTNNIILCCALLQILQQLASLQPAVDEFGAVLQPLPRAHVGLADPSCLPHIAQVILTGV